MKPFNSIAEVKAANKAAGKHFFDRKTMKFFNTKIETGVLKGRFFITSEIDPFDVKRYSLRMAADNGAIRTINRHHSFKTKGQAKEFLSELPGYFPEAFELAREYFNQSNYQRFMDFATMEPTHDKNGNFHPDTFAGACTWLVLNYKKVNAPFMEVYYNMFYEEEEL